MLFVENRLFDAHEDASSTDVYERYNLRERGSEITGLVGVEVALVSELKEEST